MALDWGKDISFSGLKLGKRRVRASEAMPSKTSMNLIATQSASSDKGRVALYAIVLAVVVALFLKFAVIDFQGRLSGKQAELDSLQHELSAVQADLANYDEVLGEYEAYGAKGAARDIVEVDAVGAFRLVDTCVAPYASVSSLGLAEDELKLRVDKTTLDGVSKITEALKSQPEVVEVSVSSASTKQNTGGVSSVFTVKLQSASTGRGA